MTRTATGLLCAAVLLVGGAVGTVTPAEASCLPSPGEQAQYDSAEVVVEGTFEEGPTDPDGRLLRPAGVRRGCGDCAGRAIQPGTSAVEVLDVVRTWTQRAASAGLRPLLLLLVALLLFHWRIGPVVLRLTATHGVHAGDLLAGLPALMAVLPHRRLRLDRRVGVKAPVSPNPMRRASDPTG